MLCHTPGYAHNQVGPPILERAQLPQPAPHALLGVFADRAGIEHDDIGILGPLCRRIPRVLQNAQHQFRIRDIHLATVGFDENPLPLHRGDGDLGLHTFNIE